MIVAHVVGGEGVSLEMLLLAGALFVLGVVFYLQASVKPVVSLVLIAAGIAIGTGSFALSDGEGEGSSQEQPTVAILSPVEGEEVPAGEPVRVEAEAESSEGLGHIHIFVDGAMVAMPDGMNGEVTLDPGSHTIQVEYVREDHTSYPDRVMAEVTVVAR